MAASRVAARRAVQARASGFPPRAVPDEHPRCVTRLSGGCRSLSSSLALLSCLSLRLHSVARAELDLEAGMYVRGMCRYALDGHAVVVAVLALVLAVRESCGGIDDRMLWRVGCRISYCRCRSRGTFWQRDDAACPDDWGAGGSVCVRSCQFCTEMNSLVTNSALIMAHRSRCTLVWGPPAPSGPPCAAVVVLLCLCYLDRTRTTPRVLSPLRPDRTARLAVRCGDSNGIVRSVSFSLQRGQISMLSSTHRIVALALRHRLRALTGIL